MLKRKIFKKICIIVSVIVIIQIVSLFPKKEIKYYSVSSAPSGVIYLLNKDNYVSRLDISFSSNKQNEIIEEIINILTISSNRLYKVRDGFVPVIPENTKLLNYKVDNDILYLNFSKEFLNINKEIEEKMIEAIIYSITSNTRISKISIKVEGKKLEKLPNSNKELPTLLDRTFKINKEYDINSMDNITSTTIYFPVKENDYLYYIPVTKVDNNKKEKVEIIIDELKSSTSHNINLVNYINEETQLINYEIFDKSLLLNFNNNILSDINSNNIIEEVTYSINLSIKENYDVEAVIYYVNNDIFNNYFLLLG